MKSVMIFMFFGLTHFASGQTLLELYPKLGVRLEKSLAGEKAYLQALKACDSLAALNRYEVTIAHPEGDIDCAYYFDTYWDVIGPGCSFYCGSGLGVLSATSTLKPTEFDSFEVENCHDLDLSTAWISAPQNHGIGARITNELEARNPRITELIVVNGYAQSTDLWKAYSRVKRLKVYYLGKPYAILNFEDVSREHHFAIGPLGESDREDYDALGKRANWQLEFEILEVYPGDEHAATAITEIYFDGIDVH